MKQIIIIGSVALLTAVSVDAQVVALNPTTMVGYAGVAAAGRQAQRSVGPRITARSALRSPGPTTASAAQLSFRPSATVRQQVYARTLAAMRNEDPKEIAELRQLLDSGIVARDSTNYLRRYGLSPTNVADATALYLAQAWLTTRGSAGDPTSAQMRGLRDQVAAAFAATPGMTQASDTTKQEIAESNLLQAMFASMLANRAAKEPGFAPVARRAAARGVQATYRIDLLSLNLTDQGLR